MHNVLNAWEALTSRLRGIGQMDALLEYIDSRLCAPIALEDLARAAGVSLRTLNMLCHRHHGVPPMELLRNMRLDAVRARLLTDASASITETALTFGFGHLGRFATAQLEVAGVKQGTVLMRE